MKTKIISAMLVCDQIQAEVPFSLSSIHVCPPGGGLGWAWGLWGAELPALSHVGPAWCCIAACCFAALCSCFPGTTAKPFLQLRQPFLGAPVQTSCLLTSAAH